MGGKMYADSLQRRLSNSNWMVIPTTTKPKRVYQVWKGSNIFFLGGRLIFGPDVRSLILTVFLIVTPVVLFAVFISHRLVNEFHHHFGKFITIIAVIFTLYDLMLLFMTSGRDPGIVPRSVHPPEPEDDGCTSNLSADWTGSQTGTHSIPPTKDVLVNGIVVKLKYCHTCMLYRPPRCSHCSVCNNCVERFDHHCPWVGQCIGKRNYRLFFMFVSSTTMLCFYIFAFCWVNLKKIMIAYECNLYRALVYSPVSGVLIIYTFVAAWFVGGLTAFHLYLVCTNQTTYENFRSRYDGRVNPYDHGCGGNTREIFFSSIPKSKNDFRAKAREHEAREHASPRFSKTSFDLDSCAKRKAVAAEEFDEIQSQLPHSGWSSRKGSWDLDMISQEFGIEHGFIDREKVDGSRRISVHSLD